MVHESWEFHELVLWYCEVRIWLDGWVIVGRSPSHSQHHHSKLPHQCSFLPSLVPSIDVSGGITADVLVDCVHGATAVFGVFCDISGRRNGIHDV